MTRQKVNKATDYTQLKVNLKIKTIAQVLYWIYDLSAKQQPSRNTN